MPTMSQSQIEMVARSAGLPGDPKVWAAVAMAESSGRTDVVNPIGCVGLWQINQPVHVKAHPTWTQAWLKDPVNNARAARAIYASQGWGAWEAYTNGAYKRYLSGGGGGSTTTPALDADDLFPWLPLVPEGMRDMGPLDSLGDVAEGVGAVAEGVVKVGTWISQPANWVRVAYVMGGAALLLVGVYAIASPLVGKAAMASPVGQVVKKAGGAIKGASKARPVPASVKTAPAKKTSSKSSDEGGGGDE